MLYGFYSTIFKLILFHFLTATAIIAQESNVEKFEYLAPLPGSSNVNPFTNIIIREGSILKESDVLHADILEVIGSKSGVHKGETLLLENSKTILFKPLKEFYENEVVTIELNCEKSNNQVNILPQLVFNFTTGKDNSQIAVPEFCELPINENLKKNNDLDISSPLNYPQLLVITNNNPSNDYLFLGLSSGGTGHLLIVSNDLIPVFYRKVQGNIFDFKYQVNNELTYNIYPVYSYGMDNSGNPTRQFYTPTGYALDIHDLQVLPDSSYYIFGREFLTIDMSQYVLNGDTAAIVHSHTIHHMDVDNNEIWQWRAIDHYDILDVDQYVNLTQHSIDWTHCNAIEIDYDDNILLSTRNFNEITKINRNTGDIIWRFGGEKNQFQIHNNNREFSRQHDVQRLSNGNLAFFNNGNNLIPEFSSYTEYKLDEANFHATLIRQYSRNQTVFSNSRGSVQELDNGNTLIGWGSNQAPSITEINNYDSIEFEIDFITYTHQSHTYRFKWKTNLFSIKTDTIDFGFVNLGDSSSQLIELYNHRSYDVIINEVLSSSKNFILKDTLPLIIPSRDEISLNLMFKPNTNGYFTDKLNIRSVNDTLLIGRQVLLIGSTDVVPVELTSFTALKNDDHVILNWSTATEINNQGFEVERKSGDGVYLRIGFVTGHGTTTEIQNYSFVDSKIASGLYTYRLKQIDFDGSFKYSSEVDLTITTEFALEQNYPNPSTK
jgi:hypothetical protein